ncbi:MAG: MBL fold metallo-hydrolase [Deltaproteobacteria bacterium]|nr:MBL fold metallo-hydrolase [Deltaproteobacteria bacterium]
MLIHGIGRSEMVVWPLRSGSTGNCLLVGSGREVILVDAGWRSQGAFRLVLEKIGVKPHHVAGILVTHTHSDHINYTTYRLAEKYGIPLYLHTRNWERAYKLHYKGKLKGDPAWRGTKHLFRYGDPFTVGGFEVEAAEVAHDGGACSCFLLTHRGSSRTVAVATDLGAWNRRLARFLSRADYLVVESNWDPDMIAVSPRTPPDVARVMGGRGHLSNLDAGALVCEAASLRGAPPLGVILAHLSRDHNTMKLALGTVRRILREGGLGRVPVSAAPMGMMDEPVVLPGLP